MNTVVTYPDGSTIASNAMNPKECSTAMQIATAQMIGLVIEPLTLNLTTTVGSTAATVDSTVLVYARELINALGVPTGTTIVSVDYTVSTIVMSNPATSSATVSASITDPLAPSVVRIDWQQQGQPGPSIDYDTIEIACTPVDTEYSRMRDSHSIGVTNEKANYLNIYTRTWKMKWTFYGPDSLDKARMIKTGLLEVPYIDSLLASSNLYVNPDIEEAKREPDLFQGQWWERVYLTADFNEEITETFTVGLVESVEVKVFTKSGQILDFTVPE